MICTDIWAATASALAFAGIAIRAQMLKPNNAKWMHAPAIVWGGLVVLSIMLGMASFSIATGAHATEREASVYSALAVVSWIMVWNVDRLSKVNRAADINILMRGRVANWSDPPPKESRR